MAELQPRQIQLKKPKFEFSKLLCVFSIVLLVFSITMAMICAFLSLDSTIFMYIIPTTGTLATASFSFYFFKAKAENLSKQRIRFVLEKLLLQDKLTSDNYQEICTEIDNIDDILNAKINGMTVESVDGEEGFDTLQVVEDVSGEIDNIGGNLMGE